MWMVNREVFTQFPPSSNDRQGEARVDETEGITAARNQESRDRTSNFQQRAKAALIRPSAEFS